MGLPGFKDVEWDELKEMLPEGWRLREGEHIVSLVNEEGKSIMQWSSSGATKESILRDIEHFLKPHLRPSYE